MLSPLLQFCSLYRSLSMHKATILYSDTNHPSSSPSTHSLVDNHTSSFGCYSTCPGCEQLTDNTTWCMPGTCRLGCCCPPADTNGDSIHHVSATAATHRAILTVCQQCTVKVKPSQALWSTMFRTCMLQVRCQHQAKPVHTEHHGDNMLEVHCQHQTKAIHMEHHADRMLQVCCQHQTKASHMENHVDSTLLAKVELSVCLSFWLARMFCSFLK